MALWRRGSAMVVFAPADNNSVSTQGAEIHTNLGGLCVSYADLKVVTFGRDKSPHHSPTCEGSVRANTACGRYAGCDLDEGTLGLGRFTRVCSTSPVLYGTPANELSIFSKTALKSVPCDHLLKGTVRRNSQPSAAAPTDDRIIGSQCASDGIPNTQRFEAAFGNWISPVLSPSPAHDATIRQADRAGTSCIHGKVGTRRWMKIEICVPPTV